ncbi:MAG: energy transducer TonB [Saprospiraceae bacterium]
MSKKKTKKDDFIQKAFYKGGVEAMKEFILGNLKYPPEAAANQVEGTVHVQYHINQRGKVFKAKALTNHGHGLEEEAIRLVKMLEFEVPQRVRGLRVVFNKTTYIHFRLPKSKPVTQEQPIVPSTENAPNIAQQVNYTITTTPKTPDTTEETPEKETNKTTYTYTIKL